MTQKKADRDTTIEDIHRERQRIAEKFGGDINAILEDARKRQVASGRAVWNGPALNKSRQPDESTASDGESVVSGPNSELSRDALFGITQTFNDCTDTAKSNAAPPR
jgi:hypothetical protein